MSLTVSVNPLSGLPQLLPKAKSGGGGGAGGGGRIFAGVGGSLPATGTEGELYFLTSTSTLYIYASGMWTAISGGGGGTTGGTFDYLTGDDFAFMDGTFFDFIT